MKRTQSRTIHLGGQPGRAVRPIDASRLPAVRGGDDPGITLPPPPPSSNYSSAQHNEALLRL